MNGPWEEGSMGIREVSGSCLQGSPNSTKCRTSQLCWREDRKVLSASHLYLEDCYYILIRKVDFVCSVH